MEIKKCRPMPKHGIAIVFEMIQVATTSFAPYCNVSETVVEVCAPVMTSVAVTATV